MDNKGIHIQIINSILSYAHQKWGISSKATLLKISQINVEDLEGLQYYLPKEIFFILLDTIKEDFNQGTNIKDIGYFCGKNIVKESVYLHPILSEGNPISFLKKAEEIFKIFFPDLGIVLHQQKGNNFLLKLPAYKNKMIFLLLNGFLDAIIENFSKYGRIKMHFKRNDKKNSIIIYKLKYQNILKKTENLIFWSIIIFLLIAVAVVLYMIKTPIEYIIPISILSYFALIYPFHIFVSKKKAVYYQKLIKELNLHEKKLLSLDEEYSHEIFRLKTSITQLTELGNSILKEENIDGIVDKLIYDALLLLGSERAIIFFYDKDRHQLYGFDRFKKKNEIRFFADEGIAGKIGKLKKPIIINDPYSNPFFSKQIDKEQEIVTKNLIGAPIIDNQGELIGVMEVSNKIEQSHYTDIDLSILTSICNYGSLAMQKYLLMQKRIKIEHERIMGKISEYFSSKSFISFINNMNIPDFPGKNNMIDKLQYFLYIFSDSTEISTDIPDHEKIKKQIIHDKRIIKHHFSQLLDHINQSVIYQCLLILIKNSKRAALEKKINFNADIFFTDEVTIPLEIRKKYRLTAPLNEWNQRRENLGENFIDFLQKAYPFMDNDISEIAEFVSYFPKLIYRDQCGGISKDIEEQIFYPFFSSYDDLFGVGLNFLSKLVTNNNGMVYFLNQEGTGVEITLLFYEEQQLNSWQNQFFL